MRAIEEYRKWRPNYQDMSDDAGVAYITGFNRAVELMEIFLKEKEDEPSKSIT